MPGMDPHLMDVARQVIDMKLAAAKRRENDEWDARIEAGRAKANAAPVYNQPTYHQGGSVGLQGSSAGGRPGTVQQQVQALALRDAQDQVIAKEAPAPLRMVQGPGIVAGYTMDTDALNGYGRQAYLPQGSSYHRPPQ
jgi:hypothetical protein